MDLIKLELAEEFTRLLNSAQFDLICLIAIGVELRKGFSTRRLFIFENFSDMQNFVSKPILGFISING